MNYPVRILAIVKENNNVKRFFTEKPDGYRFSAGQSTEISLTRKGFEDYRRPYSFACSNDAPNLEFIIKDNGEKTALSHWLFTVKPGEHITLREPIGGIQYKGPGCFIAGGTGITPFLSIFKKLKEEENLKGNRLIFSTHDRQSLIAERELVALLGKEARFHFSRDTVFNNRRINKFFLSEYVNLQSGHFYLCGPETMVCDLKRYLMELGINEQRIVTENYIKMSERRTAA